MSETVDAPGAMEQETMQEIQTEQISIEETPVVAEELMPTEEETEADKTMKALEAIPDLLAELEQDNTRYDLHIALINSLKIADLPDQLESARMNMHTVFPLTEDLWLDWINDVKKEASTEEGREKLEFLYKAAQEDYMCINVWKSYVEFTLEKFHTQFNESITTETEEITTLIEATRNDLISAVAATKYHVKQSQEIWKPYSEFELEILNQFKDPEQLKRVKTMYLDRLAVLHIDCEDTFNAYSSFVTAQDNTNYESNMVESNKIYARTKRAAEERDFFELKLVSANYSLDSFYEYIENEKVSKSMSSLNNVRNLYERAIILYAVDPILWDDYILYLIENGRVNAFLESITVRALRNCPWSGMLYAHRARLLESEKVENRLVIDVFNTALSNKQVLASGEDLVTILLAKIDYERRKIDWEDPEQDQVIDLQVAFEESMEYIKEVFGEKGDPYYRVEKYYAFMSAKRLADEDKARELWENIVDNHGRDTEAWIYYITFERDQGNYQKCESLFRRAHQKNVDNPSRLFDVWISMEREFGTLESFEYASLRINRAVKRYTRKWQAELAATEEFKEAKEQERKEKEKRKKGLHRMRLKEKNKEKKSELKKPSNDFQKLSKDFHKPSSNAEFKKPSSDFKKPAEFKKPLPVEKEESKKLEAQKQAEATNDEKTEANDKQQSTEESKTRKRKASDGDLKEDEAKKHKANEEEIDRPAPRPMKPFSPKPRGFRSSRGKALKLGGTRALSKSNAVENIAKKTELSTESKPEGISSNDEFRNMLLGKKE